MFTKKKQFLSTFHLDYFYWKYPNKNSSPAKTVSQAPKRVFLFILRQSWKDLCSVHLKVQQSVLAWSTSVWSFPLPASVATHTAIIDSPQADSTGGLISQVFHSHAHPNSQLEYCLLLYSSVTAHLTSTVYWYFLNSKSTTATAANLSISDIMLPRFPFYNKSLNIICILSCLPLTGSASKKWTTAFDHCWDHFFQK